VNGDGVADLIVSPGAGQSSRVRVFDGKTLATLEDFTTGDPTFLGGVFVGGH
jgi:hypothetical protein